MICPACGQKVDKPGPGGSCPSCGASHAAGRREALFLYLLTGAFFASLLIYGVLVVVMESVAERGEPAFPQLRFILAAISVVALISLVAVERFFLPRETVEAVRTCAILQAALAESVAIYGLALYLTGEDIQWFVLHLGLSVAGFIYLATRVPQYARLMETYSLERTSGGQ